MMDIWYADGLEEAIGNGTELTWLKDYFEKNKEEICFEGCQTIVISEGEPRYYAIQMNGDDNKKMSFLIQDENVENFHHFWTENDDECILRAFKEALGVFKEYVEELDGIKSK